MHWVTALQKQFLWIRFDRHKQNHKHKPTLVGDEKPRLHVKSWGIEDVNTIWILDEVSRSGKRATQYPQPLGVFTWRNEKANFTMLILEVYGNAITAKVNIHRPSLERSPSLKLESTVWHLIVILFNICHVT